MLDARAGANDTFGYSGCGRVNSVTHRFGVSSSWRQFSGGLPKVTAAAQVNRRYQAGRRVDPTALSF